MSQRTPSHLPLNDRLLELLADEALAGLSDIEQMELQRLLAQHPDADADAMARAAATADVAMSANDVSQLPASLKQKLAVDARAWATRSGSGLSTMTEAGVAVRVGTALQPRSAGSRWGWLAAAACLAIAVAGWWPRLMGPGSLSVRRDQLIVSAADLKRWTWISPMNDPASLNLGGEVVWSDARQEGYMVFRGLAKNSPAKNQYQLWIFDKNRDAAKPVDGGVFDVNAETGDVIIAIDPKIHVDEAVMFAVTVERPGGVVVSDRERIPALAQPPATTSQG